MNEQNGRRDELCDETDDEQNMTDDENRMSGDKLCDEFPVSVNVGSNHLFYFRRHAIFVRRTNCRHELFFCRSCTSF